METFLKKIAHRIATEQPRDTDRVLVVFNNNRSKRVFLNHFMSEVSLGFLPQVMTFDELVLSLGGLQVVPAQSPQLTAGAMESSFLGSNPSSASCQLCDLRHIT